MEALFSSLVGGNALRRRVLRVLEEALVTGDSHRLDIHIMTFSFTDACIAAALLDIARSRRNVSIRIIADWRQGAPAPGHQARRLEDAGLPNLVVRYTYDQPYRWDSRRGQLRWSYSSSRGLLHHKTLGILLDGEPWQLVCGSFNWTTKAREGYENVLAVRASSDEERELMFAVEYEFEAMWCDGRVTLSPEEARAHYARIMEEYRKDPAKPAATITGIGRGADVPLRVLTGSGDGNHASSRAPPPGSRLNIAFSSRAVFPDSGTRGYSPRNANRRFLLQKPSGRFKSVPLMLSVLALDVIGRAAAGDTLKVALYALSARVPEYGALLDAARRGVQIRVLLDAVVGRSIQRQLVAVTCRENLPIEVRFANRTMHQKYVVHPEARSVVTGTANFSTDSSLRHSEQRLLIRDDEALVHAFVTDFDTMWARSLPAAGSQSSPDELAPPGYC
jgi:phosphatidylserine/phosphatidylglycerophosphate/cardiolipin synthase-like enzyme